MILSNYNSYPHYYFLVLFVAYLTNLIEFPLALFQRLKTNFNGINYRHCLVIIDFKNSPLHFTLNQVGLLRTTHNIPS